MLFFVLEFYILKYYFPRVDIYVCVHPSVAFIEEEYHVVFVLTVEIFLVFEVAAVAAFDHEGEVDEGDSEDEFAAFVVDDAQIAFVAFDEATGRNLGHTGAEHRRAVFGHFDVG